MILQRYYMINGNPPSNPTIKKSHFGIVHGHVTIQLGGLISFVSNIYCKKHVHVFYVFIICDIQVNYKPAITNTDHGSLLVSSGCPATI